MDRASPSPRIVHLAWGRVPGIQPADLEELIEHSAWLIVLSRGQLRALYIPAETLDWRRERGVETHVHGTKEAVEPCNDLAERHRVGALIHSTC